MPVMRNTRSLPSSPAKSHGLGHKPRICFLALGLSFVFLSGCKLNSMGSTRSVKTTLSNGTDVSLIPVPVEDGLGLGYCFFEGSTFSLETIQQVRSGNLNGLKLRTPRVLPEASWTEILLDFSTNDDPDIGNKIRGTTNSVAAAFLPNLAGLAVSFEAEPGGAAAAASGSAALASLSLLDSSDGNLAQRFFRPIKAKLDPRKLGNVPAAVGKHFETVQNFTHALVERSGAAKLLHHLNIKQMAQVAGESVVQNEAAAAAASEASATFEPEIFQFWRDLDLVDDVHVDKKAFSSASYFKSSLSKSFDFALKNGAEKDSFARIYKEHFETLKGTAQLEPKELARRAEQFGDWAAAFTKSNKAAPAGKLAIVSDTFTSAETVQESRKLLRSVFEHLRSLANAFGKKQSEDFVRQKGPGFLGVLKDRTVKMGERMQVLTNRITRSSTATRAAKATAAKTTSFADNAAVLTIDVASVVVPDVADEAAEALVKSSTALAPGAKTAIQNSDHLLKKCLSGNWKAKAVCALSTLGVATLARQLIGTNPPEEASNASALGVEPTGVESPEANSTEAVAALEQASLSSDDLAFKVNPDDFDRFLSLVEEGSSNSSGGSCQDILTGSAISESESLGTTPSADSTESFTPR